MDKNLFETLVLEKVKKEISSQKWKVEITDYDSVYLIDESKGLSLYVHESDKSVYIDKPLRYKFSDKNKAKELYSIIEPLIKTERNRKEKQNLNRLSFLFGFDRKSKLESIEDGLSEPSEKIELPWWKFWKKLKK